MSKKPGKQDPLRAAVWAGFPLLRRFSITSLVAMLVTAAILVFLYRQDQFAEHDKIAAQNNEKVVVHLMHSLDDQINALVATSNGLDAQALRANPNIGLFTAALERVREHDILKLKIYNLSGTAIYSSAEDEIGRTSKHPDVLAKALSGEVAYQRGFRDTFSGITGELHGIYITSVYMPLTHAGKRIGVIETYADTTPLFKHISANTIRILLIVFGVFAVLYIALFFFLRKADLAIAEWQKAITDSEERFRKITESANDAIITGTGTGTGAGNIVGWNAAAGRVFGYTEAEIIGQPLTVLMPERFRNLHSAGLARVVAGGAPHVIGKTIELAGLRKDGSEFPLEFSLAQWQAAEGQFFTAIIRDITERKRAEDSLRKLSLAVEQSPNSIVITDLDANIEYANATFVKATGYSLAEAIGQNPRLLHSGKTPRATYDDLWAHLTRGEVWKGEFINRRKDGSEYIESVLISPVRQADGRVTNYLAIKEDITERKRIESDLGVHRTELEMQNEALRQAQTALEESRDQFVDLYEFSPVGYLTLNHEAMIDEINLTGTTLLGVERNKLLHHRFAPFVATEDRDRWHRHFLNVLQHDGQQRCELALRRSDDAVFYAQLDCLYVKADGASSVRVTLTDITERKQAEDAQRDSEELYRTMIENSNDMIWILSPDGKFTFINQQAADVTGRSIEDWLGKTFAPLVLAEDMPMIFEIHGKVMSGEKIHYEVRCKKADGGILTLSVNASPIFKDGKVSGTISFASDITERKRAEESLRQLNAELEQKVLARTTALEQARLDAEAANRAKSAFLASMSHEIRTPMNGVIGMIDVLQQSSLTAPQMEMAAIIHDSAYSLLGIINDILDFSKIEAGKLQIDSLPMSVAEVVEAACGTIDHLASKKNVELTLFTNPDIPAVVIGDAGRLRQILINLANNAIKFSSGPQRQGKVSVRAVLVENSSHSIPVRRELVEGLDGSTGSPRTVGGDLEQVTLEFRITDNGIGMDEATQARLFTAFTQADSSTTRIYGGTGLGLAISGQLANIMGGAITVQSEPGKGSTFTVCLSFKLAPDVGRMSVALSAEGDCRKALRFSDLQKPSLVAGLSCLVVGTPESLADDLVAYLAHDGAVVERSEDLATIDEWIAGRPPGLCIVLIDTAGSKPPLDGLRATARSHPEQQTRFVVIGRGQRREPRLEDTDLVAVDGNALARRTLLKAVAIASGRSKAPDREGESNNAGAGDGKAKLTLLSREEARRQGSLILIAEDNEINQKVALQQLALLGKTADIANNGREALEMWQSGDYAILITDLHMPEMDGYELTAAIRAAENVVNETSASKTNQPRETNQPRKPIIAFTANALKGEAEHCLAVGMDDYLSKPVQLVNLKAMLEKWLPRSPHDNAGEAPGLHPGYIAAPVEPRSPHDNAGNIPGFHPGYIAPTAAPVDVNVLKALVGDDDAVVRDFLHDFRLSAARIAAELRTACAAGQAADAGALAHKLKSSVRSVGALALGELCAAMEQAGKTGDMKALTALLPRFELELASVEGFLEGHLL